MGYEVHITRKEEWFEEEGPEITIEEWKNYVVSDPEMRLDGFAETTTPDRNTLRVESPGLSVWVAYSKHEEAGNMAWFDHYKDRITVKNPNGAVSISALEFSGRNACLHPFLFNECHTRQMSGLARHLNSGEPYAPNRPHNHIRRKKCVPKTKSVSIPVKNFQNGFPPVCIHE